MLIEIESFVHYTVYRDGMYEISVTELMFLYIRFN